MSEAVVFYFQMVLFLVAMIVSMIPVLWAVVAILASDWSYHRPFISGATALLVLILYVPLVPLVVSSIFL